MEDFNIGDVIGWLITAFIIAMLFLGIVYVISLLVRPVVEALGETISMFTSGGQRDIYSLATLCLVFIGAIGLAKLLTRKKR